MVNSFEDLVAHHGHELACTTYAGDNVVVECLTCNQILVSFDRQPVPLVEVVLSVGYVVPAGDNVALGVVQSAILEDVVGAVDNHELATHVSVRPAPWATLDDVPGWLPVQEEEDADDHRS